MKRFTLLIGLIICCSILKAQDVPEPDQLSKITYDYDKDELTGIMPFDQFFKIIIKGIPPKSIQKALFYEVEYKKDKQRNKKIRDIKNKKPKISELDVVKIAPPAVYKANIAAQIAGIKAAGGKIVNTYEFKEIVTGITKYRIEFIQRNAIIIPDYENLKIVDAKGIKNSSQSIITPVAPERFYELVIVKNNSEKNHLVYNEFLDYFRNNPANVANQTNLFRNKIIPLQKRLEERSIRIGAFPIYFNNFLVHITPVTAYYNANSPTMSAITPLHPSVNANLITTIADLLKQNKLELKDYKKLMPIFHSMDVIAISQIANGLIKDTKNYDYNKRLKNLKSSIEDFQAIKKEMNSLQLLLNQASINNFIVNFLTPTLNTLTTNYTNLKSYNDALVVLVDQYLPELVLISASTLGNDLKTSNANSLIPDVGLVNAVNINSDGDLKYIGRPYLGLNWHFAGIDRTQYLREIPEKKFRHRWSLAIGITIGKIDNEDYEDFYNSISPTLGLNYRLTRQIRAGLGTLFIREKNSNPILDKTKVILAPYVSLSFDLGLFQEASKLIGKIGI